MGNIQVNCKCAKILHKIIQREHFEVHEKLVKIGETEREGGGSDIIVPRCKGMSWGDI
jgi:hypothetical protein